MSFSKLDSTTKQFGSDREKTKIKSSEKKLAENRPTLKEKRKRPDKQLYVPRALRGVQDKSLSPQNRVETESEKNSFVKNDKEKSVECILQSGSKAKSFPTKHPVSEIKNAGESSCNMVNLPHHEIVATDTIVENEIVSKSVSYPLPDKLIQNFEGSLVSSSPDTLDINLQCDQNYNCADEVEIFPKKIKEDKELSSVTNFITYNIQDPRIEGLSKQVTEDKQLSYVIGITTQNPEIEIPKDTTETKDISSVTEHMMKLNLQDIEAQASPQKVREDEQLSVTGNTVHNLHDPEIEIFPMDIVVNKDISSVTEKKIHNLQDIETEAFPQKVTEEKQISSVTGITTQNHQDLEIEIFPKGTLENKDILFVIENTIHNLQDIKADAFPQKATEEKQISSVIGITTQNHQDLEIEIFPKGTLENKDILSVIENTIYNLQDIKADAFPQKTTEEQLSSITGIMTQNLQDPEIQIFPKDTLEKRDILSVTESMIHNHQDIGTEAFPTEDKDISSAIDSRAHTPQNPGTQLTDKPISSEDNLTISDECSLKHIDTTVHSRRNNETDVSSESFEEKDDSWETKFNDDGECLNPDFVKDLCNVTGRIKVIAAKKNYSEYQPLSENAAEGYDNIVELFDFPLEFNTQDLVSAFSLFQSSSYTIKWVDDSHALAIFTSPMIANQALQLNHPFVKVRPISEGIKESKSKARWCARYCEPIKPRPTTSAVLARRLVSGALGLRVSATKEQRERERNILKEAKEKRRLKAKQRQDMWDGVVE